MTNYRDDLIKEYLGYAKEATFGVDPAWGPNEPYVHDMGPREHSFKMDFKFDKDEYAKFHGYGGIEQRVPYPFKIYNLVEFQMYTPKGQLLEKAWCMPAEGFDD